MTVLIPKGPRGDAGSGNHSTENTQTSVTALELVAMAGTIVCTALSVGILVSRLLGYSI